MTLFGDSLESGCKLTAAFESSHHIRCKQSAARRRKLGAARKHCVSSDVRRSSHNLQIRTLHHCPSGSFVINRPRDWQQVMSHGPP